MPLQLQLMVRLPLFLRLELHPPYRGDVLAEGLRLGVQGIVKSLSLLHVKHLLSRDTLLLDPCHHLRLLLPLLLLH